MKGRTGVAGGKKPEKWGQGLVRVVKTPRSLAPRTIICTYFSCSGVVVRVVIKRGGVDLPIQVHLPRG